MTIELWLIIFDDRHLKIYYGGILVSRGWTMQKQYWLLQYWF